jgi:hypothetical protein
LPSLKTRTCPERQPNGSTINGRFWSIFPFTHHRVALNLPAPPRIVSGWIRIPSRPDAHCSPHRRTSESSYCGAYNGTRLTFNAHKILCEARME